MKQVKKALFYNLTVSRDEVNGKRNGSRKHQTLFFSIAKASLSGQLLALRTDQTP